MTILLASPALGQGKPIPNPPGLSILPFNFSPPGARSLGMGNTFVGLADDATASESNPAGLIILSRPEASLHYRSTSSQPQVLDLNAVEAERVVSGPPVFNLGGSLTSGDPVASLDHSSSSPSFISFVYPSEKWSLSAYYNKTIDFRGESDFTLWEPSFRDFYSTEQAVGIVQENLGLSAAFRWGKIAFGASVRLSELDISARGQFQLDFYRDFEILLGIGATPDELFASEITDLFRVSDVIEGTDRDLTYNVGILINPQGRWTAGAVYKHGGIFDIAGTQEELICLDFRLFSSCDPENPNELPDSVFNSFTTETRQRRIRLPDLYGLGIAWRPGARLAIGLDLNLVTYSNLGGSALNREGIDAFVSSRLEEVEDEIEIAVGLEYFFFISSARLLETAARAGYYSESDHDGIVDVDSSQDHYTLGIGMNWNDFQVDLTGHLADRTEEILLSVIYKMGRT